MQLLFGIKSRFQLFFGVCVKQLMCNIFNLRKNVKDSEFGILYFSITYLLKCDTKINNLAFFFLFFFLRWDEKKKKGNNYIQASLCFGNSRCVYLLLYVDDIVIYHTQCSICYYCPYLSTLNTFWAQGLRAPPVFLGLQVDYMSLWLLFINGNTFANSWLNFTCLIQTLAPSPISSSSTLCISATSPLSDPTQSCSLVGSLQYAAFTKLDIAFVVILP